MIYLQTPSSDIKVSFDVTYTHRQVFVTRDMLMKLMINNI